MKNEDTGIPGRQDESLLENNFSMCERQKQGCQLERSKAEGERRQRPGHIGPQRLENKHLYLFSESEF